MRAGRRAIESWEVALERFRRACDRSLEASSVNAYLAAIGRAAREAPAAEGASAALRLEAITAALHRRRTAHPRATRAMTSVAMRRPVRFLAEEGALAEAEAARLEERVRAYRAG